jgi:hypothetical protein
VFSSLHKLYNNLLCSSKNEATLTVGVKYNLCGFISLASMDIFLASGHSNMT